MKLHTSIAFRCRFLALLLVLATHNTTATPHKTLVVSNNHTPWQGAQCTLIQDEMNAASPGAGVIIKER